MRFIPINLDNVKNAATMFVGIANKEPWNGEWTYSSAYARLFTIAKSIGFMGLITMDNNGLPCGFVMGNTVNRADGGLDFLICEICYQNNEAGLVYAKKTLDYLEEQLEMRHIVRALYVGEGGNPVSDYFAKLNFSNVSNVVMVEKRLG
ncbi:MAG: hypothetical protein IJO61_00920 [Oscillospiraceae bacterium]|nr:hypothetical protein [Oscillospiraceae bacterium]MBQ6845667.1 hypothetical protein [Oscillospiraceae bacterium]MBQ7120552.1 hypothetical protein [Oscillospiraceae bacterium]